MAAAAQEGGRSDLAHRRRGAVAGLRPHLVAYALEAGPATGEAARGGAPPRLDRGTRQCAAAKCAAGRARERWRRAARGSHALRRLRAALRGPGRAVLVSLRGRWSWAPAGMDVCPRWRAIGFASRCECLLAASGRGVAWRRGALLGLGGRRHADRLVLAGERQRRCGGSGRRGHCATARDRRCRDHGRERPCRWPMTDVGAPSWCRMPRSGVSATLFGMLKAGWRKAPAAGQGA